MPEKSKPKIKTAATQSDQPKSSQSSSAASQVSDATVKEKTGKDWSAWLKALDAKKAMELNHKAIVALLAKDYPEVSSWWQQMITVTYERARGLRDKHEKSDGYVAGASKTLPTPLPKLYLAWKDGRLRKKWLGNAAFTVTKATENKSLRLTWNDGSKVDVYLTAKGEDKSMVAVQHEKLKNREAVDKTKAFWKGALERLKEVVFDPKASLK